MRTPTPALRALILGAGATVGVVLVALAAGAPRLSDGGKLLDNFPGLGKSLAPVVKKLTRLNGVASGHGRPPALKPPPSTGWVNIFELSVLGVFVLAIIWFLIIPAVRDVDWSALRLPPEVVDDEDMEAAMFSPEAAEELSSELTRMIESLDEDADPRHAVLGCWLRLEEAVGRSGFSRRPAESSEEFTTRVLAVYDVDGETLARLHGLYRAARYSAAPVSEAARSSARAALAVLRGAIEPTAGASFGRSEPPSLAGLAP